MEPKELCERLTQLTKDIPGILNIREDTKIAKDPVVLMEVQDPLPNQEDAPWRIIAMHNDAFRSAVSNTGYACIEFLVFIGKIDPSSDGYYGKVAGYCLPWVDHQRMFPGPSFRWDPDTGSMTAYVQVWDDGQPKESMDKALKRSLVHLIGLVYYSTCKKWEIGVRDSLGKMADPIVQGVCDRMNELLGGPKKENEDDSID